MDEDVKGFTKFLENFGDVIMKIGSPKIRKNNIERDYDAIKNVNSEICTECGGACCKKCGCHFAPSDFKELTFEYLKREIERGYISIDCVDGEMIYQSGFFYILRVRNQGAPIVDFGYDRSRTPCSLLTKNGCKLSYDERPTGGKLLIPSEEFCFDFSFGIKEKVRKCEQKYEIETCCFEWRPYASIIGKLVQHFRDKDFSCTL